MKQKHNKMAPKNLLILLLYCISTNFGMAQASLCNPLFFKNIEPMEFCNYNGIMLIRTSIDGLWKSDGTAQGTTKINAAPKYIKDGITIMGNEAYFISGKQLWKTNGTEAGTIMIHEIININSIGTLKTTGNLLFFLVETTGYVNKLWKSDGTAAGTSLVKDIDPSNSRAWDPRNLVAYNNQVYFKAGNNTYGNELWKSDGTAAGTVVVRDVRPGSGDGSTSLGQSFIVFNGELYFLGGYATSGVNSFGLWKTNGTDAGTVLVKELNSIDSPTEINGLLYFWAYDIGAAVGNTQYGQELWRSDGTAAGTYMVKDIRTGSGNGASGGSKLVGINDKIVFGASDGTTGIELWASDGTEAGTVLLQDMRSGAQGSLGNYFTASDPYNGYIYFGANNGIIGQELWTTDGTSSGTKLVSDIRQGPDGSGPWNYHLYNSNFYFSAEISSDNSLWTCGNISGIEEIGSKPLLIYPNPTADFISIKTSPLFKNSDYIITNQFGQTVLSGNLTGETTTLDISVLPVGLYFLHLSDCDQPSFKLVKH